MRPLIEVPVLIGLVYVALWIRCTFYARLNIRKARSITLTNNRFYNEVKVGQYEGLKMTGNVRDGMPFDLTK